MSGQTGRELPSGVVKFTLAREGLKDISSDKYNEDVESFSVDEEGKEAERRGAVRLSGVGLKTLDKHNAYNW